MVYFCQMKRILEFVLTVFVRFLLWLRYRIHVKGMESLSPEALSKPGGILFLANHPAEIDPCILLTLFWNRFRPHPVAIDYLFRKPGVRFLLEIVGALPIPNFEGSSNSYKRRQIEITYEKIFALLDRKENLLIYPAGGLKNGPEEIVGGASGVHNIINARPNVNVVLIRSTGLWGSSFSRAPTGRTPNLGKAFFNGFKVLLRNFLFFAPRRDVVIECTPAPDDFPWKADRRTLNRYLEQWYNANGPEPLKLVSFSRFREIYPAIKERPKEEEVSLEKIPQETKEKVLEEIEKLARDSQAEITLESHLSLDLGLDSLDLSQLVVWLKDTFGVLSLHSSDLTTVGSVLAFAAKLKTGKEEEEEGGEEKILWEKEKNRPHLLYPEGNSLPEVFLKTCQRMDGYLACVDNISGEVTYRRLKMGVILLAQAIQKLPGERIGVMMPASVAVYAVILATMLAGKIPVMINWTLGERNLLSVIEQSGIKVTLSSWNFLDRVDNIELNGLDDHILILEEMRRKFSLLDKVKALWCSKKKVRAVLKQFGVEQLKPEDPAVILFTSGTESIPKGVPLSHQNLMANQRSALKLVKFEDQDILLGALPSFHSFGFSVTGLFPLMAGFRVAYSPNPTDGRRMASAIERWEITLLCLAPTFLKNLLRVANPKQLKTLKLVVVGAEKMAPELYDKLEELNPKTKLIEGYGITECSPILTINPPDATDLQGVGIPLPGVEIKIVDPETMSPLPQGEQGVILARGPNIFRGYLNPDLPSPFIDVENKKWYHTGDLGYLDTKGYLTLSGRLKRFVKIGGEMLSLTAIEEALGQMASKKGWELDPEVPNFAVCAVEEGGRKTEMHLFTTLDLSTEEVNQSLRESGMSNLIKMRSVKKVAMMPLLGSGKVDYRRLCSQLK